MGEAWGLLYLVLIMVAVVVSDFGVTVIMRCRTAIDGQRTRLVETAQSWVRLLKTAAGHDAVHEQAIPGGPEVATLNQIVDARQHREGFGETGEFTLARLEGDDIVFPDIKMPVMNGADTCHMMKRLRPEQVAVKMMAYAVEDLVQETLDNSAYSSLHKPMGLEELLELVGEVSRQKR